MNELARETRWRVTPTYKEPGMYPGGVEGGYVRGTVADAITDALQLTRDPDVAYVIINEDGATHGLKVRDPMTVEVAELT